MRVRRLRAEHLFLLFALPVGFVLCFLIPPLGGGNEKANLERTFAIAYGGLLIHDTEIPRGLSSFIAAASEPFQQGALPPYRYSLPQWKALAAMKLQAETQVMLPPNPIAVLHPLSYPQALFVRIGAWLGVTPLAVFYLARLAGLLLGSWLMFAAIRTTPSHTYLFCALALLPTITFMRSCLDADQITNGLAFLFIACAMREIKQAGAIAHSAVVRLALLAFILAQCKSAYLLIPLLSAAIPQSRFGSPRRRIYALMAIVLPGLLAGLLWMAALKYTYFSGMQYRTWGGEVNPDLQMAYILSQPWEYLRVLGRTLFLTPLIPEAIRGILGVFGPPVALPSALYGLLAFLLIMVAASDRTQAEIIYSPAAKQWAALIAGGVTLVILTLLYLQWTGLHAPVILGFQGRYLYPLLPLLGFFIRPFPTPLRGLSPAGWGGALAAAGLAGVLTVTYATYWQ